MTRSTAVSGRIACLLTIAGLAYGQRGSSDWMTTASDAQRSSWVRSDGKISLQSMSKPGFQLSWKMKFDNQARGANNIAPPALLDFYIGYRGFRALGFFAASEDKVIAVDTELARGEWENRYSSATAPAGTPVCPGGMTSAVTRPTGVGYPPPPSGRGSGRGSPAKSGVGGPHEGSVVLAAVMARATAAPPPRPAPAPVKPGANATPAPSPFAPHVEYVLALSGDGKLHSLWVSNGNEPKPGVEFIPPNANALGLIAYNNSAYVATTGSCGEAGNGVWSIDLTTNHVNHWKSSQEVAGTAGPAAGPDGTLYVATGSDLVALSHEKLETVAIYRAAGTEFSSTPVVFDYKGKDLVAVASKDGRVHLLDTASLNGETPLARSEAFATPGYAAGALASWQDLAGTRWVLVPSSDGIVAMKVVESGGNLSFEQGWKSREMTSPLTPIIVNGVVFAVSRAKPSVLYALDALSGQELWNSGNAIESEVRNGGLAAGGARVYVATHDGTQYAFGFPIEH